MGRVHAECDNITNERFKHNNYYCPDCKIQHELAPTILEEQNSVFNVVHVGQGSSHQVNGKGIQAAEPKSGSLV
ncbi:putative histone-lysine N-methyltransferase [Arabidopsis thaliana]